MENSLIELMTEDDEEHILCVYKEKGLWASIAQSKYLGLKSRNPVYMTIRDLAVSYMEFCFNFKGFYSLRSYTNPIDLIKYSYKWLYDRKIVFQLEKDIRKLKHFPITRYGIRFKVATDRYWNETKFIPKEYLKAKPK